MNRFALILILASLPAAFATEPNTRLNQIKQRMEASTETFHDLMETSDNGVPRWVIERAQCAVIVPSVKKGAFFVGAHYGKGFVLCRTASGWSAPFSVRIEGGSFGLQFGGGEVDAVLFVMNRDGMRDLMKSRFTLGLEAGAMAGPVGRTSVAETDALMRAKILSYSRSHGVFAGIALNGATLRPDDADNVSLYGKDATPQRILNGAYPATPSAQPLIAMLGRYPERTR